MRYAPLEPPHFEYEHLVHEVLEGDCTIGDVPPPPDIELRLVIEVQSGTFHFWLGTGRHAERGQYDRDGEGSVIGGVAHRAEAALRSLFTSELGVASAPE